jgi:hypothetical protein
MNNDELSRLILNQSEREVKEILQTKFQKSSFLVSLDDVNVYNNKTREIVGN